MTGCIAHRGPDSSCTWLDAEAGALGHRRQSILDLSSDGHLPMPSRDGCYVAYHGEVYNFAETRRELRAHPAFRVDVDRDALTLYLRHYYVPPPSIYPGISKVEPASIVTMTASISFGTC